MNVVAADVRRLILFGTAVRASSRRLPGFKILRITDDPPKRS